MAINKRHINPKVKKAQKPFKAKDYYAFNQATKEFRFFGFSVTISGGL